MTDTLDHLRAALPDWIQEGLGVIIPALQILLIMALTLALYRLLRRLIVRTCDHYQLPHEMLFPVTAVMRWLLLSTALLLVLERLGVSASVLWAAFTGFATVGAVAFFAAWSVLSNLFCAFLIFIVQPFRVGDYVELLDASDKPGALGRVISINLLFTTLEEMPEEGGHTPTLRIPNTLIFQKVLRRWKGARPQRLEVALGSTGRSGGTPDGSAAAVVPAMQTSFVSSAAAIKGREGATSGDQPSGVPSDAGAAHPTLADVVATAAQPPAPVLPVAAETAKTPPAAQAMPVPDPQRT